MDGPESPEVFFSKALFGPLLKDEAVARDFAAFILKRLYGEAVGLLSLPWRSL